MFDRFLAIISVACLIAFVGVLIGFIGEIDLIIITVVVLVMAVFDFYLLTRPRPSGDE